MDEASVRGRSGECLLESGIAFEASGLGEGSDILAVFFVRDEAVQR